jgi:uncharacterized protein (DUF3820 family)
MELRLNFGKHRGKLVTEIPDDYLIWCLRKYWSLGRDMREAMKAELHRRVLECGPGPRAVKKS